MNWANIKLGDLLIDTEYFHNLIDSVLERLNLVIEMKGFRIDH